MLDSARKKVPPKHLPAIDLGLIDVLKNNHKEILSLYELTMQTARERRYSAFTDMLGVFATECTNHFQKEDEELYGYLKILVSLKSKVEEKVFNEFVSEMKNVSISIFSTINQSPNIPVSDSTVDGFIDEFTHLGGILKDRIKREETIVFPMYENSRMVANIS